MEDYIVVKLLIKVVNNSLAHSTILFLLRGLTLGSKFLLLVYIAKVLPTKELGVYGIFTATLTYALYIIGLDFYTYVTRELLGRPVERWTPLIRDQIIFQIIVYIILMPFLLLVFIKGVMDWKYAVWFYILLTLEHLSQEAYRLLIVMQRPVLANVALLFRMGAWGYVALAFMWFSQPLRQLSTVFGTWLSGVTLGLIISWTGLRTLNWSEIRKVPICWNGMRSGVRVAITFLAGTLALRGVYTADRYFIQYYLGDCEVGIYMFYLGITSAVQSILEGGVLAQYYPELVSAYRYGFTSKAKSIIRSMTNRILISLSLLSVAIITLIGPIVNYVNKKTITDHKMMLWILLASTWLWSLSMIPHYRLYALGFDRQILVISLLVFLLAIFLFYQLIPLFGELGAPFALTAAGTLMLAGKTLLSCKIINDSTKTNKST